MKKIVLTPNPYRDRNFKYVTLADKLLREAGLETRICLAFDVDRSFELPDNVVLTELNHELRDADLLGLASAATARSSMPPRLQQRPGSRSSA